MARTIALKPSLFLLLLISISLFPVLTCPQRSLSKKFVSTVTKWRLRKLQLIWLGLVKEGEGSIHGTAFHSFSIAIQYSMKVPPFATKLCVFSLLFYTALHVSAYKQAIFKCYLINYKKVKLLNFTPWIH
jgi:hypothetical protein